MLPYCMPLEVVRRGNITYCLMRTEFGGQEVDFYGPLTLRIYFITSRVSGRGHRIGAVCMCLSALSRSNHLTYDLDF